MPVQPDLRETFVLLDNSSGKGAPSLLFETPVEIVVAREPDEAQPALAKIAGAAARGLHAAGFLAYELGYVLEPRLLPLLPPERAVPLLWFGLYRAPSAMSDHDVERWLAEHLRSGSYEFRNVTLAWDRAAYGERFTAVREKILAGDIYQLNLTFKARFELLGSPLTFYRDLRRRQRVAYGGIVDTGEVTVLSASPELFIAKHGRVVETRPMKGTASRAGVPDRDVEERGALASDEKQRAENLMIVDLMRNDLGRIAETGGVSVSDLFTVETYRTLHQMTSGVHARLRDDIGFADVIRAIFPPGSVTGAPKIRAMELIRALETGPRGVYCGAIGAVAPSGEVLFNVAIRSPVVARNGQGEMGIGSGLVIDSNAEKEYAECLLKMKFLVEPPRTFELIETMLFEPGRGIALFDRHLDRLETSSAYFGFSFDRKAVTAQLLATVADAAEGLRVRLLLAEDGTVTIGTAVQTPSAAVMRFVVSPTRVSSADPFLFHKTTRRDLYDREWKHYSERLKADEVIYLNERDEVTEGSRTTIFVERDGRLATPALSAGLLPGTLRAELLASGQAEEAILRLGDLKGADAVYLGNSVRGLVRALPLAGEHGCEEKHHVARR